jgi:predicted Zn-dependent peptidase
MTTEAVGAEELQKAKDYTVGSFRLSLESSMALGQRAGESLLMLGEIEPVDSIVAKLRAVTADDVIRVAQRILKRERAALAIVGPSVDEPALRDVLGAAG